MRLLARDGQRSAALAQYETCRRVLERDLGVEPEAETTALYERIRGTPSAELSLQSDETQHVQNFPAQTTALIGRETELAELGALVENPACRLITIVGPGGMGKSRLALAVAAEQAKAFTHGAAFVPLTAISSAEFLVPAVLAALDIAPQAQRDPRDQLLDYLRAKELLLLLDNVEQLLASGLSHDSPGQGEGVADLLSDMLHHAPGVTLLVTSRERLAVPGEWLFDLAGLSYPPGESPADIDRYSAVRLFVQRAGQVRRQFALDEAEARAVARICRLVEGLPLAIELAAAALRARSCKVIADAIESSVMALMSGLRAVPERHRSMWATFEHSWRLLSDEERQVFARLSVFRGGFEEDAAAQVAQATPQLLAALLDKSLLRWDGAARYDMHELVRQYASEKLEQADEIKGTRNKQLIYCLVLAEQAEQHLHGTDQVRWIRRLEQELENIRAALSWSTRASGMESIGPQLTCALAEFWMRRGFVSEARHWLAMMLALSPDPTSLRGRLLNALGAALVLADRAEAQARYEMALALGTAQSDPIITADACFGLGWVAALAGRTPEAQDLYTQSLALCRQVEYRVGEARALNSLGEIGDEGQIDEALAIYRQLGDVQGTAWSLMRLGMTMRARGESVRAVPLLNEALVLQRQLGDKEATAWGLSFIADAYQLDADHMMALKLLDESLALFREAGNRLGIAFVYENLSDSTLACGDVTAAAAYLQKSLRLFRELGYRYGEILCIAGAAAVSATYGQHVQAAQLGGACENQLEALQSTLPADVQVNYDKAVLAAHAQLDDPNFEAAWAAGRSMTWEQAIAYALEGSDADIASSIRTTATSQ
jgi:predicted ATPase